LDWLELAAVFRGRIGLHVEHVEMRWTAGHPDDDHVLGFGGRPIRRPTLGAEDVEQGDSAQPQAADAQEITAVQASIFVASVLHEGPRVRWNAKPQAAGQCCSRNSRVFSKLHRMPCNPFCGDSDSLRYWVQACRSESSGNRARVQRNASSMRCLSSLISLRMRAAWPSLSA